MRQPDGSHLPPPDAALLQFVVDGPGWTGRFPPVPPGCVVTASVSAADLLTDRRDLERRGYKFAGAHRPALLPVGVEVVHLLVPATVAADHPRWWRTLTGSADRIFPLTLGPVLAVFGDLLAVHAAAGARDCASAEHASKSVPPASGH